MKNDYIKQRKEELTHIARDMIDYQKSILELEGERYSSSMTGSRSLNPESHLESGKDVNWIISACRSYETKYHKAFSPKKKRMKAKQ